MQPARAVLVHRAFCKGVRRARKATSGVKEFQQVRVELIFVRFGEAAGCSPDFLGITGWVSRFEARLFRLRLQ